MTPKETLVMAFRVSPQKKQAFEIECQQNGIDKGKVLRDLFDQRHVLAYLKQPNLLLVEGISEQNIGYLEAHCTLKSRSVDDLLAELIQNFIDQENNAKLFTDTTLFENGVNSSQVSGLQPFTNVYSGVNSTVNSRLQQNFQKTVNSVNRQNTLENIGKMLGKEMLSVRLCNNAGNVIDYAVKNSGLMSRQLDEQLLYQMLFENFSHDQIDNLTDNFDDSGTD